MRDLLQELLRQAHQARREDRLADARNLLVQAVDLARKENDQGGLAHSLSGLGQIERDQGNASTALARYTEAAAIYRSENDPLRLAHTVRHLGDIHQDARHLDLAEPCYREALELYRNHPQTPPLDLANAIRGLALLKRETGDVVQAKTLWQEAKDLYSAVGVEAGVAECSRRIALLPWAF